MAFIDRIMGANERLIAYVQKVLGNAVSGDANSQFFPIFWGEGANGKSTLLGIAQYVLGDYASIASDSLLTVGRQEHPTELADLQGRRLVIASETEEGGRLRVQLVKRLTGEVRMKARRMRQDFYEFDRTHHIILQTNNRPRIDEDSEAVFRRIRLVPFTVIIPLPERDPGLLDKLKAEASGVLTWLVMGCLAWQREGLDMPPEVADANQNYREESNPLGEFVDDCCTIGPGLSTGAGMLRQAYERHCTERGIKPISGNKFAERLLKMGFERGRNHAGRLWAGIGLLTTQHEYAGEA
jgi:putative DNA primase/helicase